MARRWPIAFSLELIAALLFPAFLPAQETVSPNPQTHAKTVMRDAFFPAGALYDTELVGTIDAKKMKAGDVVVVRPRADVRYMDARGQVKELKGHVTGATARANGGGETSLSIVFTHAVLKNGTKIPFPALIDGMAPPIERGKWWAGPSPSQPQHVEGAWPGDQIATSPMFGPSGGYVHTETNDASGEPMWLSPDGARARDPRRTAVAHWSGHGVVGLPGIQLKRTPGAPESEIRSTWTDFSLPANTLLRLKIAAPVHIQAVR
jgi:hypothetical protein